jgi:flagellar motility protein MotE (MotC chaperone)
LPLVGVALGGVLALKAVSGLGGLPDLFSGAKAFAENAAPAAKSSDPAAAKTPAPPLPAGLTPTSGAAANGSLVPSGAQPAAAPLKLACGSNAADLARDAGLSPAELQILQSLGTRRGQLDEREQDMDAQTQLMTAAEAKLDAKLAALAAMKGQIQGLLDQADQRSATEIDRLVTVYSQMKPRDAAARMTLLDDSVRLPIAAKMKERALSAILGQMPPADAKALTEKLAGRLETKALADARSAISAAAPPPAAATTTPPPTASAAAPTPAKAAKAPGRRRAKAQATAADTGSATPAPPQQAASTGSASPAPPQQAAAPAKSG